MLVLESQKFDLNALFSFDSLKLILIKLAKSQKALEDEIKTLQKNIYQNDKININIKNDVIQNNDIEKNDVKSIKEKNNEEKEENNDINFNEKELNNYYKNNLFENEKTNDINLVADNEKIIQEKNAIKDNIIEKNNEQDDNKNLIANTINNLKYSPNIIQNIPQNIDNNNSNINTNQIEFSNIKIKQSEISEKEKEREKEREKEKYQLNSNSFISPDFSKLIREQKELRARINSLEIKLSSKEVQIHNIENKMKNNSLENEFKFQAIDEKIDKLNKKDEEIMEKIEKLEVKTSDMDIFSLFKDSGDGNIDITKVLVKSLEEKVFRKFDLIDEKYKRDAANNMKLKTNVENILPKMEQINREIERINEANKQFNEEINLSKKENEQKINDNINEIYEDMNKKIQEINSELDKNVKSKISNMEKNVNNLISKSNENNGLDFLKLSLGNSVEPEKIEILTKKINDMRTKMNDMENSLKLYINSKEIDSIKNDIKDLRLFLDKKITKDDLKELYNFHLSAMDEITDIKDRESIIHDDLTKTVKNLQNLQQRVESLNGNISLLQNNPDNENLKIIDFNKYIDNKKFSDTLKPILKEFENINREIDSLRRELSDSSSKNSNSIKSAINLIEDDVNNKINELKKIIQKKYLEKLEYHKGIKSLEIQLKSNIEEKKKLDAESWLLAKKPLNCFNCASCEAKIKNDEYVPADYLAWKKYPRGEKIHRMGQGFSHMLQMMTSEFIKNIEKNEFGIDNEPNSRNNNKNNLNASPSYQLNEKQNINLMFINNSNRDKEKERDDSISFKKKTKITLPKMGHNSKNKIKLMDGDNLPVSDDENNNDVIISDNNAMKERDILSPKILKITKKTKLNLFDMNKNKSLFKNLITSQGGAFTSREKIKELE